MFAQSDFENTKWVNLRPNPCQFQVHPLFEHRHCPPSSARALSHFYFMPTLVRSEGAIARGLPQSFEFAFFRFEFKL